MHLKTRVMWFVVCANLGTIVGVVGSRARLHTKGFEPWVVESHVYLAFWMRLWEKPMDLGLKAFVRNVNPIWIIDQTTFSFLKKLEM
jgi:hypothetical protein